MILSVVFALFILMLLFPFLPGIIELIREEDSQPLYIPMDYMRNPRYFGISFKKILSRAVGDLQLKNGRYNVVLSKKEKVKVCNSLEVADGSEFNMLFFIKGDLSTGTHVLFEKELHVNGNVVTGAQNVIQALNSEGRASIGPDTVFRRWLDAEGDIAIARNCNLGISVASGGRLSLGPRCIFRRLYGMPVVIGGIDAASDIERSTDFEENTLSESKSESTFIRRGERSISPGTVLEGHTVFTGKVTIGTGSVIKGTIKSYDRLELEDNVVVHGNVFSDDDIIIGRKARIGGNVFSQKTVHIAENAIVGDPGKVKSVIGKRSIQLEKNVMVYGFVSTEGDGAVLWDGDARL